MYIKRVNGPVFATGLNGEVITRSDLPPADTKRWVARRKAAVVAAVNGGLITAEEACRRYALSMEELDAWRDAVARHGARALRVTTMQTFR
ncbi:DUF1153 domain-containing protein [Paroceanicella profunda]|uniref:DUF1153 domain-containing protein n=1 Tax=Paroceanicella profunda TaxID=2579971 RepID=A0A5B8FY53_9RHOB|nr:DUF1153 domain-containing protein [Paroceanicella profunda]QDL92250.1 DUF1153 domain-containing protein [Paroceanicella profunda]